MTENSNDPDSEVLADFMADTDALRVDESKILDYLLNLEHPIGKAKAKFFVNRGFARGEWKSFADALRNHAQTNPIASTNAHDHGIKYIVDCTIAAPSDDSHCIRVVWNDHNDGEPPRLITAHPLFK